MAGIFSKVKTLSQEIKTQKPREDGTVAIRKAGRPRKPNTHKHLVSLSESIYNDLSRRAHDLGIDRSAVITLALREYLKKDI